MLRSNNAYLSCRQLVSQVIVCYYCITHSLFLVVDVFLVGQQTSQHPVPLSGGLRGANAKEPEFFLLPEKNSKEELMTSEEGDNEVADRLLEEQENDDFEPVERAALPLLPFLGFLTSLCPFMA